GALGIRRDELDAFRSDAQLVRRDLPQGRFHPLSELGLAREDRDLAVLIDANPCIEQRRTIETARQTAALRGAQAHRGQQGKADHERYTARENGPSRNGVRTRTHGCAPDSLGLRLFWSSS